MSQDNTPHPDSNRYPDQLIEGHEYDGIQEYDNPMPAWWLWLFYATIAWSVFYIAALGIGWIDDYDARLEKGQERIAEKRAAAQQDATAWDSAEIEALLEDDAALTSGEDIYAQRCAQCHGDTGGGGVGTALDDDQWDHGAELSAQFHIIKEGYSPGGMPAHSGMLSDEEIAQVTAFINTF